SDKLSRFSLHDALPIYDVMLSEKSVTLQMTEAFEKSNKTVVGVQAVTKEAIKKYATCKIVESYGRLHKIDNIVEKPQREEDIYRSEEHTSELQSRFELV